MTRREAGFSIVELLIVMVIIGFAFAAGSDMFISVVRGYKQQNAIAETKIEGIIGLEMLRRDIESAGYGLPWQVPIGITYEEAINSTAASYNDSPSNPPRGLVCGDNITTDPDLVSGADYLVIKAVNLAKDDTCTKWAYLLRTGETATTGSDSTELDDYDRVIVISPGSNREEERRTLRGPTNYVTGTALNFNGAAAFSDDSRAGIVYGVAPRDSDNLTRPLRMPFNRADYYVSKTADIPGRCADGTGILVKSILNHDEGKFSSFPLLDCVADMQVIARLDTNGDGQWETPSNGFFALDAETVRSRLHEVRVYILAHEGQRDVSYAYPTDIVHVGEPGYGRDFNFAASGIANWQNYRWKVYTLIVKPLNIRESNFAGTE